MTRVLVTVGTTTFPSLVRYFDRPAPCCDVVIQHADPARTLRHARGFAFSDQLQEWYAWADVVVTHAGAGTVYALLEARRRVVVVPNLERVDKHQRDLASHVATRGYAMVVDPLDAFDGIDQLVSAALDFEAVPYVKTEFFKTQFLLDLLAPADVPARRESRPRAEPSTRTTRGEAPGVRRQPATSVSLGREVARVEPPAPAALRPAGAGARDVVGQGETPARFQGLDGAGRGM